MLRTMSASAPGIREPALLSDGPETRLYWRIPAPLRYLATGDERFGGSSVYRAPRRPGTWAWGWGWVGARRVAWLLPWLPPICS